jgi:serine/threonine-protein kinase
MSESPDLEGLPELALLAPGTEFGSYVVQECVGQGAMGSVYRAVHALLAKPVALKIMDSTLLGSAEARQRFLREGQTAASIKHPNVVDITDVGFMGATPYLVMELLEGEDLSTYLERIHRLSEDEAIDLFMPIVAALAVAHDSGVVHRDLKPSNIFLAFDREGDVDPKLLDFGISKLSRALENMNLGATPFNQLMGSPLYLPPEAVNGSGNMTPKSDQYSLALMLYECLIGRPPFSGNTLLEVLNAISKGVFSRPREQRPELSLELESAILRAMHPDPARRFEHVRDFGRALIEVATLRTQMRWGRTFGRRDLSDAPRSLPASARSIAAPNPPRRAQRVGFAAGAAMLTLLALLSWIGATASKPDPARTDAASADRVAAPATLQTAAAAAAPAEPAPLSASSAHGVREGGAGLSTNAERSPAVRARAEVLERPAARITNDRRRRDSVAVRPEPAVATPNEPREQAAAPKPADVDELNPFSIRRAAPLPAPRRAVVLHGANEAPILD